MHGPEHELKIFLLFIANLRFYFVFLYFLNFFVESILTSDLSFNNLLTYINLFAIEINMKSFNKNYLFF